MKYSGEDMNGNIVYGDSVVYDGLTAFIHSGNGWIAVDTCTVKEESEE